MEFKKSDIRKQITETNFISLGGWCGSTISLRGNGLYAEALPFDHIRASFEGVIDCFENDFLNFFPKKIEVDKIDNYEYNNRSFRGRFFGFYHHDLYDKTVIQDFNRRIKRLKTLLETTNKKIIFIRTISTHDYNDELNKYNKFINITKKRYKNLNFQLIFIIPGQNKSEYFKSLCKQAHVFKLIDNLLSRPEDLNLLKKEYKPIYNFILNNDLFQDSTPIYSNSEIKCENGFNRFAEVDNIPITRSDN